MLRYETQVELLSQLLHKPVAEVQMDALRLLVENLEPPKRNAFCVFVKEADQNGSDPQAITGAGPGFRIIDKLNKVNPNLNTTKGRIVNLLRNRRFSRTEFTAAVEKAMEWDEVSRLFGVKTKFSDLSAAEKAWWGTLKGKERLIVTAE